MSLWQYKAVSCLAKNVSTYIVFKIVERIVRTVSSFQITCPSLSFSKTSILNWFLEKADATSATSATFCIYFLYCTAVERTNLPDPMNCTLKSSHGQATETAETQDGANSRSSSQAGQCHDSVLTAVLTVPDKLCTQLPAKFQRTLPTSISAGSYAGIWSLCKSRALMSVL